MCCIVQGAYALALYDKLKFLLLHNLSLYTKCYNKICMQLFLCIVSAQICYSVFSISSTYADMYLVNVCILLTYLPFSPKTMGQVIPLGKAFLPLIFCFPELLIDLYGLIFRVCLWQFLVDPRKKLCIWYSSPKYF